ncbi:hypothetical protein ACFL20_09360 [Spirochaetota bacterium]
MKTKKQTNKKQQKGNCEVIKFDRLLNNNKEYKKHLDGLLEHLKESYEKINLHAINLAAAGVWKEWSDSIPVGSYFQFNEKMLLDCGDKNVVKLLNLLEDIDNTIDYLGGSGEKR